MKPRRERATAVGRLVLSLALLLPVACATTNPREESILQGSYRSLKKYDLLERTLKENLTRYEKVGSLLGRLYTMLDLAEVYTHGLVNFRQASSWYRQASLLNEEIKQTVGATSRGIKGTVRSESFYRTDGEFTYERAYDPAKVFAEIERRRERLDRLLGDQSEPDPARAAGAGIGLSDVHGSYDTDEALGPDLLDSRTFDAVSEEIYKRISEQILKRHKLSPSLRQFYLNFNVARALIRSFGLHELTRDQIRKIRAFARGAEPHREEVGSLPVMAYLSFMTIVCDSLLGLNHESVDSFATFQTQIERINREAKERLEKIKAERRKALATGVVLSAGMVALDVLTAVAGGRVRTEFWRAVPYNFALASFQQRQVKLIGESEYAKDLNSVLNIHEQLTLWDGLGRAFHQMGVLDRGIAANGEAIAIINGLRSTISTERQKISFARQRAGIYNRLIDELVAAGNADEAFQYAENARSRAFVDLLGSKRRMTFKQQATTKYVTEAREGRVYLSALRAQTNISDEQAQYANALVRTIAVVPGGGDRSAISEEVESLITVSTISVREVQRELASDVTLVEFYLSDENAYAWIIDRESSRLIKLSEGPGEIRDAVARFHRGMDRDEGGGGREALLSGARALFEQVFMEPGRFIKTRKIYVVGHQVLHFLPMEALHDGKGFLVERYSFSYIPSATVLKFLKEKSRALESILAVGNPDIDYRSDLSPLPGTEREVLAITERFSRRKVLLREAATETAVKAAASEFDIIHVASHGFLDSANPMASGLVLARDDVNDGELSAEELYGMQLKGGLVTLSACETGLSQIENGDELIGLLRGFFFAGARSVVASLWKVDDDATARLMASFYRHLDGTNKGEALRRAKLELLGSRDFGDPFYWAAFNLFGLDD